MQKRNISSSGAKYGFPHLKEVPDALKPKCMNQEWDGLEIRSGLKEGRGVFATKHFEEGDVICNYGGTNIPSEVAENDLLPFDDKCNYLVEIFEECQDGWKNLYVDCSSVKTYGQTLNHSRRHPNVTPDVYARGPKQIDLIFRALRNVEPNEQLVWNYGNKFSGVCSCVESCKRCKS